MLQNISKEKKMVLLVMGLYIIGVLLDVVNYFIKSTVSGGIISNHGIQAVLFLFFRFFIVMGILTEVNKGKNWARIVFVILALLGTISYLINSLIIFVNIRLGLMSIAVAGLYLSSALILLISKSAKDYFNISDNSNAD